MTAACITFEQIEDRTDNSLVLAIWAKRASETALAAVVGNMFLAILSANLKGLHGVLTTEALEKFSPDQLKELSVKLKELMPRFTRLCSEIESSDMKKILLQNLVSSVSESTEDLDSVLENINFSLRPDFQDAISSAIDRLRLGAEASATVPR